MDCSLGLAKYFAIEDGQDAVEIYAAAMRATSMRRFAQDQTCAKFTQACSHPGGYFARIIDQAGNQLKIDCNTFNDDNANIDYSIIDGFFRYCGINRFSCAIWQLGSIHLSRHLTLRVKFALYDRQNSRLCKIAAKVYSLAKCAVAHSHQLARSTENLCTTEASKRGTSP